MTIADRTDHGFIILEDGTVVDLEVKLQRQAKREQAKQTEIERQTLLLESGSRVQRQNAVKRLGQLHNDPALFLPLLRDTDSRVRSAAAVAIGNCDITELRDVVTEELLSALDDRNDYVVQGAIRSLGVLRLDEAHDELLDFFDDPNQLLVEAAILALGRIARTGDQDRLLDFLDSDRPGIRARAAQAMEHMNCRPAIPKLVALLESELQNDRADRNVNGEVKLYVSALGKLKAREAIPLLLQVANNVVGLRSAAVAALMQIGADEALPVLLTMLGNPSQRLQKQILGMARHLDYRAALPYVRPLLSDPNVEIRNVALYTINYWNDLDSVDQVRSMCYRDPNPFVRRHAVFVLSALLGAAALEDFTALAVDPNPEVRRAVAESLRFLPALTSEALVLLQVLAEDSLVGNEARKTLVWHEQDSGVPMLSPLQDATKRSAVPSELLLQIPGLTATLKRWQYALARDDNARTSDEHSAISAALSVLIFALEREQTNQETGEHATAPPVFGGER